MKTIAVTGLIAVALGLAPLAHAESDDTFFSLLAANGIPAVSGPTELKRVAHQVCDQLNGGVPAETVVAEWEDFANANTPGQDPARVHRTAIRFVNAASGAYCPGHQVAYHGRARFVPTGATEDNGSLPLPQVPDAAHLIVPAAPAPSPPPKAPPSIGPPASSGGGNGNGGGGAGGNCSSGCEGPGMVALAP